jgi:hypothetical protein
VEANAVPNQYSNQWNKQVAKGTNYLRFDIVRSAHNLMQLNIILPAESTAAALRNDDGQPADLFVP